MNPDEFEKTLLDLRKHSESEFEKLIIYIASGGLALTISFSDTISKINHDGRFLQWLVYTWVCFALTIIAGLMFHYTSIKAIDLRLVKNNDLSEKWNSATKWLYSLSIILLLIGICSFITYAILSINP